MVDEQKARYRDISDGLLRQRRNIMLVSLLLPLFFLSGASIDKINILGTIITVANPTIIKYSLVVLFGYFFLRYWQYYQEETYVKNMARQMCEHIYHLENMYLLKKARNKASFLDPSILSICFADPRYSSGGRFTAIPKNKDKTTFPFMRSCEFYIHAEDRGYSDRQEKIDEFHIILSKPEFSNWRPLGYSEDEKSQPRFYREYLSYSIIRFHLLRFIGMCRYMFNESYFTDYQLPFILAIISALVTVYAIFI